MLNTVGSVKKVEHRENAKNFNNRGIITHKKLKFLRLYPSSHFLSLEQSWQRNEKVNLAEFFPTLEVLCLHGAYGDIRRMQDAQIHLTKLKLLDIRGCQFDSFGNQNFFETAAKNIFVSQCLKCAFPPDRVVVRDGVYERVYFRLNKKFLEKIEDVDCNIWPEGFTVLHMACLQSDLQLIKFLVEQKKANVNAKVRLEMERPWKITVPFIRDNYYTVPNLVKEDWTSLHIAAMRNAREVLEYLLQHGANTEQRDPLGRTPFHYAVMTGSMEAVEALRGRCELQAKDKQGMHAGFFAVNSSKAKEMLEKVVEIGVKIEEKDNEGRSVHQAALSMVDEDINQYGEMFDRLPRLTEEEALEVVVAHLNRYGEEFRLKGFSYNSVKLMAQKYKLDLRNKIRGKTFLMHVLSYSELELERLFEAIFGPNEKFERLGIEEQDDSGNRALHYGVAQGTLSHVKFLLRHGADISAENKQGITPLLAFEAFPKITLFLKSLNVSFPHFDRSLICMDPETDYSSSTGVSFSLDKGEKKSSLEIIECLLSSNLESLKKAAKVSDRRGVTPLHLAAVYCPKIVGRLLELGADVNAKDSTNITPLMYAAMFPSSILSSNLISGGFEELKEVIECLLENGAEYNSVNQSNDSVFSLLAGMNGGEKILVTLLDRVNPSKSVLSAINKRGHCALSYAVLNGQGEVVTKLISMGADVNASPIGKNKGSLLHLAILNTFQRDNVKLTTGNEASFAPVAPSFLSLPRRIVSAEPEHKIHRLNKHVRDCPQVKLKAVLFKYPPHFFLSLRRAESGSRCTPQDQKRVHTEFYHSNSRLSILEKILFHSKDLRLDTKDCEGNDAPLAFFSATKNRSSDLFWSNPNLDKLFEKRYCALFSKFLEHTDVNLTNSAGNNAVHFICKFAFERKQLLSRTLPNLRDWNSTDKKGRTILHHLMLGPREKESGFIECLEMILEGKKVDVNKREKNGKTALHYFVEQGEEKEEGALKKAIVSEKVEELFSVEEKSALSVLFKSGADGKVKDQEQMTAFHIAARKNSPLLFSLLREAEKHGVNANVNEKDRNGRSVVDLVCEEIEGTTKWDFLNLLIVECFGGDEIVEMREPAKSLLEEARRDFGGREKVERVFLEKKEMKKFALWHLSKRNSTKSFCELQVLVENEKKITMKDLEEILSQNFLGNSHKRKTVCNSLTNSIHEIKKLQLCSEEINKIGNILPKRRRYREEPMDYYVHDPISSLTDSGNDR